MENHEITKKYLEDIQRNTWENPQSFDSLGKARVDSLRETIDEIKIQIVERQRLSDLFIKEGEAMKTQIKNFLLESSPRGEDDSEFARERAELRKKQIEISEIQLNEKVGAWRDIALLKKELRDREKELSEKESRIEMIEGILKKDDKNGGGFE